MRCAVAWLPFLVSAVIGQAGVGVYTEDNDDEYEAPGVEPSSLEVHQTRTHDEESGDQYNYVEQAAQEQRAKGAGKSFSLSDLLGAEIGKDVEVVNLKDGVTSGGLKDLLQQVLGQMGASTAKPAQ